ncbi:hypothetical protein V8G54_024656, partial [Vigna mungo]
RIVFFLLFVSLCRSYAQNLLPPLRFSLSQLRAQSSSSSLFLSVAVTRTIFFLLSVSLCRSYTHNLLRPLRFSVSWLSIAGAFFFFYFNHLNFVLVRLNWFLHHISSTDRLKCVFVVF